MMRALAVVVMVTSFGCATGPRTSDAPPPRLETQTSGTTALLQAVSPVNERVAWVSGQSATWARTVDGGARWTAGTVPGADSLQFRDVHAVDSLTAYLLAAGPGARSRIYKTINGGTTWTVQFVNRDSAAFFDCFDFWSPTHGIAFSDAAGGRFPIRITTDGLRWEAPRDAALPAPMPDEGGFAASGTCVVTQPGGRALIGTGNGGSARVLTTVDFGRTWTAVTTPMPAGEAAGITSLAFRDARTGVAFGGRLATPTDTGPRVFRSSDGGESWAAGGAVPFAGAVYGGVYVPGLSATLIAVGPGGAAISRDDGRAWAPLDTGSYWSAGFASPTAGWLVGPNGRITKVDLSGSLRPE